MRLVEMRCMNCNAPLDIDPNHIMAFCPYCGTKLMFDMSDMENIFVAREQTRQEQERTRQARERTMQSQEQTVRAGMYSDTENRRINASVRKRELSEETERFIAEQEYKTTREKEKSNRLSDLVFIVIFICCALVLLGLVIFAE